MKVNPLIIKEKIKNKLENIKKAVDKEDRGFRVVKRKGKDADFYLDSVAFNLHSFYSGIEQIFEIVSNGVDEDVPSGSRWHKELLEQMSIELLGIRPTIISNATKQELIEFLTFRHLVRDIYTFEIKPEKLARLVKMLPNTFEHFMKEINDFLIFLERLSVRYTQIN